MYNKYKTDDGSEYANVPTPTSETLFCIQVEISSLLLCLHSFPPMEEDKKGDDEARPDRADDAHVLSGGAGGVRRTKRKTLTKKRKTLWIQWAFSSIAS